MTWQDFYFGCFLVGFALSLVSFLLGSFHFHFHFHGHTDVFHAHLHGPAAGHGGLDAAHSGGNAAGHATAPTHGLSTNDPEISWFNFGSITAFLAWFGGAGYLLTRFSGWLAWVSFGLAVVSGVVGGAIMFWFVAKVLMKHDKALDPIDYEMIGVLGTVTSPIREGGTGEIVFSQEGVRKCAGARADQGEAIPKGTEVIVTRYEKGLAYVRLWEEMANGASAGEGDAGMKG
jgi:membrane protein implicated in regulation of membrane protease activity